jgi:hypothetical protein
MKKIHLLLLCSTLCAFVSAQTVKTASELNLTNKGLYIGTSTALYIRGGLADPTDFQSRSLFDWQYRFANQFSAGFGLGYDYEKAGGYITNYTLTRLAVLPELRYWPHKEPQRLMPYLFLNYGWEKEKLTSAGDVQTDTYGLGAAGAGCTGWLNEHWGLQLRGDILNFRKNQISLFAQPLSLVRFGVVFKTSQ